MKVNSFAESLLAFKVHGRRVSMCAILVSLKSLDYCSHCRLVNLASLGQILKSSTYRLRPGLQLLIHLQHQSWSAICVISISKRSGIKTTVSSSRKHCSLSHFDLPLNPRSSPTLAAVFP